MSYRIINGKAYSVGNYSYLEHNKNNSKTNNINDKASFKDVLDNVKDNKSSNCDFTISKHAALRLNDLNLSEDDMKKIEKGFQIAADKNSKDTVMIFNNLALIASVENRTLITAVNKERAKDNIFTNVDSVVIL